MIVPNRREPCRPIPVFDAIGTQRTRRIQVAAIYVGFVFAMVGNAIANHAESGVDFGCRLRFQPRSWLGTNPIRRRRTSKSASQESDRDTNRRMHDELLEAGA